ncbi:putative ABC transporter permease [Fervidibacillus albus]|uniref:ABC transporter permease n=1 Tax=Fervidibacillus albus TaxID=2980026 RepID=A0A9E8RVJ7_9BACI|nr:putative ABC transporter permease [Fervidibacillus albus]WAA09359.1 putative ABC transporter permease [Fervidibacillus albus]
MGDSLGDMSVPALVFYFTLYSFFGWFLENSFSFTKGGPFFKHNFFKGPFKPMYGIAPVLLLIFSNEDRSLHSILLLCLVIPTSVEYVSGVLLEKLFHLRYWDYSNEKYQIQGHICLAFSTIWVILSFVCLKWIHPVVASIHQSVNDFWRWLYPFAAIYFIMELGFSFLRYRFKSPSKKNSSSSILSINRK